MGASKVKEIELELQRHRPNISRLRLSKSSFANEFTISKTFFLC